MSTHPHAETVGSLQRPDFLLAARAAVARGELVPRAFKQIEDRAVNESIELQESVGLQVVTDGEQRRESFHEWLITSVEGVSLTPAFSIPMRGLPGHPDLVRSSPVSVTGKLSLKRFSFAEEFTYARARTTRRIKVTVPRRLPPIPTLTRSLRMQHACSAGNVRSWPGWDVTTSRSMRRN